MVVHIKDVVQKVVANQNSNSWQINLLTNWNSIIGGLKTKVKLEKIQDDTLILGVYDSSWMQELYLLSNVIIKTINSKLDQPRIKHIRFKRAEWKNENKEQIKEIKKAHSKKIELSSRELFALKKIRDPQLSEALKNFLIKCRS